LNGIVGAAKLERGPLATRVREGMRWPPFAAARRTWFLGAYRGGKAPDRQRTFGRSRPHRPRAAAGPTGVLWKGTGKVPPRVGRRDHSELNRCVHHSPRMGNSGRSRPGPLEHGQSIECQLPGGGALATRVSRNAVPRRLTLGGRSDGGSHPERSGGQPLRPARGLEVGTIANHGPRPVRGDEGSARRGLDRVPETTASGQAGLPLEMHRRRLSDPPTTGRPTRSGPRCTGGKRCQAAGALGLFFGVGGRRTPTCAAVWGTLKQGLPHRGALRHCPPGPDGTSGRGGPAGVFHWARKRPEGLRNRRPMSTADPAATILLLVEDGRRRTRTLLGPDNLTAGTAYEFCSWPTGLRRDGLRG